MKKMYNQPVVEAQTLLPNTRIMDSIIVSPAGGNGTGVGEAPRPRGEAIH